MWGWKDSGRHADKQRTWTVEGRRRDGNGESGAERRRERESDRGGEKGREREGEGGKEEERGREPGERDASRRLAGRAWGEARRAGGSQCAERRPGPAPASEPLARGRGKSPLARSMSFSDSSATFLLNEVNAGDPSPVGGRRAPLQARKRARIWGRLQ